MKDYVEIVKDKRFIKVVDMGAILAWQPLPEPYEQEVSVK